MVMIIKQKEQCLEYADKIIILKGHCLGGVKLMVMIIRQKGSCNGYIDDEGAREEKSV